MKAASNGALNIEPDAWAESKESVRNGKPVSKYPAQVSCADIVLHVFFILSRRKTSFVCNWWSYVPINLLGQDEAKARTASTERRDIPAPSSPL